MKKDETTITKKPSLASKLSRAKKKPESSKSNNLNKSDEDFVQVSSKKAEKKKVQKVESDKICPTESSSLMLQSCDVLLKCPFCGKTFVVGQELKRASHLKSCGASLGVPTEKLLQLRRLEEKQASEWKDLNLPSTVASAMTSSALPVDKTKTSNKSRSKDAIKADPQLEMALALSASLAAAQKKTEAEFLNEIGELGEGPSKNAGTEPEIILPEATSWPIGYDKKPATKNSLIKTTLQTRTDPERFRQISEMAEKILYSEFSDFTGSGSDFKVNASPNNYQLKRWRLKERPLWKAAETQDLTINLVEAMKPFLQSANWRPVVTSSLSTSSPRTSSMSLASRESFKRPMEKKKVKVEFDSLEALMSHDWLSLFESGRMTDLTIFSKEEIPFPVHSLVMHARCKNILHDTIEENDATTGKRQIITWDDIPKSAAQIFIKYLYSAKLPDHLDSKEELIGLTKLAEKFNVEPLKKYVKLFSLDQFDDDDVKENSFVGGFINGQNAEPQPDEQEVVVVAASATQNLDILVDALNCEDVTQATSTTTSDVALDDDKLDDDKLDDDKLDDEWEEMCDFLTQKKSCDDRNISNSVHLNASSSAEFEESKNGKMSKPKNCDDHLFSSPFQPEQKSFQMDQEEDLFGGDSFGKGSDDIWDEMNDIITQKNSSPTKHFKSPKIESKSSTGSLIGSPTNHSNSSFKLSQSPIKHLKSASKDSKSLDKPLKSPTNSPKFKSFLSPGSQKSYYSFTQSANLKKSSSICSSPTKSSLKGSPAKSNPNYSPSPKKYNFLASPNDSFEFKSESDRKSFSDFYPSPDRDFDRYDNDDFEVAAIPVRRSESPDLFADESGCNDHFETDEENKDRCLSRKRPSSDFEHSSNKRSRISTTPQKLSSLSPAKMNVLQSLTPPKLNTPPKIYRSHSTPTCRTQCTDFKSLPITPKPNYEAMLTPALRKELRRFGLKAIPREKALPLLSYIYEENHPQISKTDQNVDSDDRATTSGFSKNSNDNDESDEEKADDDCPEETMLNDQLFSQGPAGDPESLVQMLIRFIEANPDLHRACLTYEPIWLEDVFSRFKQTTGFKCSLSQFTDALDNECITFRTRARQKNNRRSPKKKKSDN